MPQNATDTQKKCRRERKPTKMAAYELPDLADLFSKLSDDDLVKLYQDLLQELDEIVAESKPVDPAVALQRAAYEEEMVGRGMQNLIRQDC